MYRRRMRIRVREGNTRPRGMGPMLHHVSPPLIRPASVKRRRAFVAIGVGAAAVLAVVATVLVNAAFASSFDSAGPLAPSAHNLPFDPTTDDGLIRGDEYVTLADEHLPAIARLDPTLRDAMRQAETDAAIEGLAFQVTSGWRSAEYQQWLLDDAVEFYADENVARQFVATPEKSRHVTGEAVDIVPLDAQFWLIENGSRYGICQTYANERWHFERATEPGGVCPEMKTDAAS